MDNPALILDLQPAVSTKTDIKQKARKGKNIKSKKGRDLVDVKMLQTDSSDATNDSNSVLDNMLDKKQAIKHGTPETFSDFPPKIALVKQIEPKKLNNGSISQEMLKEQCNPVVDSYFRLLVEVGQIEEAFENFKFLRGDNVSKPWVNNILVFDILLRGFARKFQFSRYVKSHQVTKILME